MMDINIKIALDEKPKGKGLMGVSLEEIQAAPVIVKKKKKKKKKSDLMKMIESSIPAKPKWETEVV